MAIRKVTGSEFLTPLYSKDENFDLGQLIENLILGDILGGNTITIGKDGSITITGALTVAGNAVIATKTPASSSATGTTGEIAWDADFFYVCVDTDTWVRTALATWA